MKTIEITKLDFTRITSTIYSFQQFNKNDFSEIAELKKKIKLANKRDSSEIGSNYLTMNSIVEVTQKDTGKTMQIELVYPKDVNSKAGKISILSPLGNAIIGKRVGTRICYNTPKGKISLKVNQIIYQPEANGDYHL